MASILKPWKSDLDFDEKNKLRIDDNLKPIFHKDRLYAKRATFGSLVLLTLVMGALTALAFTGILPVGIVGGSVFATTTFVLGLFIILYAVSLRIAKENSKEIIRNAGYSRAQQNQGWWKNRGWCL